MTPAATTLLIFAAVACLVDWVAVNRELRSLEYVAKPMATVFFLLSAVALDTANGPARVWLVAALVFCLAGDVFLMLPRDTFVPGLASFAVAQVLFAGNFLTQDPTVVRFLVGVIVGVPVTLLLARRFIGALVRVRRRELIAPVIFYMVVITVMMVSAMSAGTTAGVAGALLFVGSDSLIAETRFVRARSWHGVSIMVTYHAALAGLVLSLV